MRALKACLCVLMPWLGAAPAKADVQVHRGMCDPSGAVAWPEDGFDAFIVANDEDNRLRAYTRDRTAAPPRLVGGDLGPFLPGGRKQREADLEAATWLGGRIYWIGSHGRNSKGKPRPERSVFFATTAVRGPDGAIVVTPVGTPHDLRPALSRAPVGLAHAIGGDEEDEDLAPERKGLNIEGLTVHPDGASLLIALRNPLRDGKAILVPFRNPEAVTQGREEPRLDAPLLLDLGGRGIRSIEYSPARSGYVLVAGPTGAPSGKHGKDFGLYRWSGRPDDRAVPFPGVGRLLAGLRDRAGWFAPEAVIVDPSGRRALLLSDDGDRELRKGVPCKEMPEAERAFRSLVVDLR